jgi:hypothetical protein
MYKFSNRDLMALTTEELISELKLRQAEHQVESNKFVRQALQNHIGAVEHVIAIHNARATTELLDGMPGARLRAVEATLMHDDTATVPREVVAELVAEVRRLQGVCALLVLKFRPDHDGAPFQDNDAAAREPLGAWGCPPAAEDFGAEPVVHAPLHDDQLAIEVTSAAEVAELERVEQVDAAGGGD